MINKVGDQRLKCNGIAENGEDVKEGDALLKGSILENQSRERNVRRTYRLGEIWVSGENTPQKINLRHGGPWALTGGELALGYANAG